MAANSAPFQCHRPGPPLSEFVDFLWTFDGYLPRHARERLLPTGTMELVFRLNGDGRLDSGVAGPRSQFAELETARPFSVIAVHFKPGGGTPFFGVPGGELHNRSVALEAVWGPSAVSIRDRLWEADSAPARFRILEHVLLERASGRWSRHAGVRYALGAFERWKGKCAVRDVVQRLGISQRRFIDLFRSDVGLSPKMFCRIRRFNDVLTRIEPLTEIDWLDVALSCGYFDQAHFNHDFQAFSGINPSTYLKHRSARTHVALTD